MILNLLREFFSLNLRNLDRLYFQFDKFFYEYQVIQHRNFDFFPFYSEIGSGFLIKRNFSFDGNFTLLHGSVAGDGFRKDQYSRLSSFLGVNETGGGLNLLGEESFMIDCLEIVQFQKLP